MPLVAPKYSQILDSKNSYLFGRKKTHDNITDLENLSELKHKYSETPAYRFDE